MGPLTFAFTNSGKRKKQASFTKKCWRSGEPMKRRHRRRKSETFYFFTENSNSLDYAFDTVCR